MGDENAGANGAENASAIDCVRCGRHTAALEAAPQPGEIGEEIRRKICPDCWDEWQRAEVMVINELRLNFMDPRSLEILEHHMREFLMLSPGTGGAASEAPRP